MLRKVLLAGNPAELDRLRKVCEPQTLEQIHAGLAGDEPDYEETLDGLLTDMFQTMIAENGMGLASNQIGYLLRIFILKDTSAKGYSEYINPEVLSEEELVDFEQEGCLSIPGIKATTKRFRKLRLRWQDRQGTTHEGDFGDVRAFAVQHEMDHLNGKLYVDQFSRLLRKMIFKKHKKHLRSLGRS